MNLLFISTISTGSHRNPNRPQLRRLQPQRQAIPHNSPTSTISPILTTPDKVYYIKAEKPDVDAGGIFKEFKGELLERSDLDNKFFIYTRKGKLKEFKFSLKQKCWMKESVSEELLFAKEDSDDEIVDFQFGKKGNRKKVFIDGKVISLKSGYEKCFDIDLSNFAKYYRVPATYDPVKYSKADKKFDLNKVKSITLEKLGTIHILKVDKNEIGLDSPYSLAFTQGNFTDVFNFSSSSLSFTLKRFNGVNIDDPSKPHTAVIFSKDTNTDTSNGKGIEKIALDEIIKFKIKKGSSLEIFTKFPSVDKIDGLYQIQKEDCDIISYFDEKVEKLFKCKASSAIPNGISLVYYSKLEEYIIDGKANSKEMPFMTWDELHYLIIAGKINAESILEISKRKRTATYNLYKELSNNIDKIPPLMVSKLLSLDGKLGHYTKILKHVIDCIKNNYSYKENKFVKTLFSILGGF